MLRTWGGTREERGKERWQVVGKCVGIVKSAYCIYWLYHYCIKTSTKLVSAGQVEIIGNSLVLLLGELIAKCTCFSLMDTRE